MVADGGKPDPIVEELARARPTARRYWWRDVLVIPDLAEMVGGWVDLPRGGRWLVVLLLVGLIMLLPAVASVVALLG